MRNLISMTDFVLHQYKLIHKCDNKAFAKSILKYANFLKQPLELWMFIPCDLVMGKVIVLNEEDKHYQQAKERCLFEGFKRSVGKESVIDINNTIRIHKLNSFSLNGKQVCIIEDLVKHNLQLAPTAIKQLQS